MLYLIATTNPTPSKAMNANDVELLQPWRLKSSGPALQSQNSGINTSVIHKIKAISLHSCHILGAKSVNKNYTMDKCLSWEVVLKSATKPSWWSKDKYVLFSLYNQITKKQIQE